MGYKPIYSVQNILRNINTFSKGILSFWKTRSRLWNPSYASLFSPDASYDAVRRTGWSNNMHSGKGEGQTSIWSRDVCGWFWDFNLDRNSLVWDTEECSVGPAIARVFFGWRLVRLLAQTNVLNSLSLLLSVSLFLSISQALLQWCLRTCPRTLNRLGLSPVSSSNALPRAHAWVQKHFTFMHLASAFAVFLFF